MSFIDALLLDRVSYGFTGGPTWATTRVQLRSGRLRRNAERSRPLYRFNAPYGNIDTADHDVVIQAYNACMGPLHSFRFMDRSDFQLDDVIIGTADGTTDQQIQLIKPYGFGTETVNRTIAKPIDSAINYGRNGDPAPLYAITSNDVPIAHTIDYSTGIVTLTGTLGETIRATGWFDVPVYFDDDALQFSFENWDAHTTDINLAEDFGA